MTPKSLPLLKLSRSSRYYNSIICEQFVRKHAIKFPAEEFALALGLALPRAAGEPWPLGLRDSFLNKLLADRTFINMTRKRLGQHFLKSTNYLREIANAADPRRGETIIEVGAGHGELTDELSIFNSQFSIIAIEKDEKLADYLQKKFSDTKNIKILKGDALKIIPPLIENLKIDNWKLTGNVPYYITGRLLRTIGELEPKPKLCVFTLQKEVAERIVAKPPRTNKLSVSVQFWAEPKIIGVIPKKYFQPAPEVDSAIITLSQTDADYTRTDAERYYKTVNAIFRQPRKTILNNLSAAIPESKEKVSEKLKELSINPQNRPQNLSVEEIKKLSTHLPL